MFHIVFHCVSCVTCVTLIPCVYLGVNVDRTKKIKYTSAQRHTGNTSALPAYTICTHCGTLGVIGYRDRVTRV